MRSALLSTFAAMALAAGCVGSLDPQPPGGGSNNNGPDAGTTVTGNAKADFDANVYPIAKAKCIGCHSSAGPVGNITGFVATDAAQGYTTMTGYTALVGNFTPTGAALLQKINQGHQGITYTADETAKITSWLNAEAAARSGGNIDPGNPPPGTESPSEATERVLKQWSGCMSLDNFNQANMASAWGGLTTTNNQECDNCHTSGAEGFIASRQADIFFNTVSTNKYYMLQYFTVDLTQGTAAAKVIINTVSFQNVSQGQDPHRQHPRFNATDNNGMRALQSFYDLTTQRMAAGTCDPSRLTN